LQVLELEQVRAQE
jgi:hypothetical protein